MTPPTSYTTASGRPSGRWLYEDGEQLCVELGDRSFTVLWSARTPAQEFVRRLASLVNAPEAGHASLYPASDDEREYTFADAVARLDAGAAPVDFMRLDFPDGVFTWEAPEGDHPASTVNEIGVHCSSFRADWLRRLIGETATPLVVANLDAIIDGASELTHRVSPAAK